MFKSLISLPFAKMIIVHKRKKGNGYIKGKTDDKVYPFILMVKHLFIRIYKNSPFVTNYLVFIKNNR